MFPDPEAEQAPPPVATQVHVAVREAGKVSATVAPLAFDGPALFTMMLYVIEPPGTAAVTQSVTVIARSADGVSVKLKSAAPAGVGVFSSEPITSISISTTRNNLELFFVFIKSTNIHLS
jgi:hypothetical protein